MQACGVSVPVSAAPQDCSDEAPNYHSHNDEVSQAHTATLRHCSAASSWSPLSVTRFNNSLQQFACGVTQPKDIETRFHDSGDPGDEGTNNRCYHQRCPPWHWHVLQDNKVLEECRSEEQEKRREKQSKEDWGNTWHYQEWKEVLQASSTLHTLGLGSATALTLSLYRDWSKHYPCPHKAKDEQQQMPNGANKKHNLKNNYDEEQGQKNEGLLWHNCRDFKQFFNSEVHSQETSADTLDKDRSEVTCEVPNHPGNTVIYKPNVIKSAENEAHGSTIPVNSLQQKSLELATTFIDIQGNVKKKNKTEEIFKDEVALIDESELLFCPQSDKSDVTDRTDSGCMSDLHQDFQSQTTTNSEITNDQYNEDEESNANRIASVICTRRPVSTELELQVEVKDGRSEHSQGSRTHKEPEKSCADGTKMKTLHDRLLELVKADREDQLEEVFKKDGNILLDTKPEEAIVYFQAGVMMGDPSSAFNLALCYHMGYGITQDLEKARKLYEAAAAAGHGLAIYNLAVMVSQGLGGPCVPQRVHSLLQQAAKMGITEAAEALSVQEMEKQEQSITYEEEPQLRKCYSEPSLHSSLTNQPPFSHSTDDLLSLLDEDIWADNDLSTDIICQKN